MEVRAEESWKQFVKEHIIPVHQLATKILNFYSWLSEQEGRRVIDGFNTWPGLEIALFGGVRSTGEYEGEGLALRYRDLLGLNVNVKEYFSSLEQLRYGIEPETTFTVQSTPFIRFLKRIQIITQGILASTRERGWDISIPETSFQDLQEEPLKLVSISAELLNKCANVTANASDFVLTAWSLWGLSKKYIRRAYPEAEDPYIFSWLCELLGLKPIFTPPVSGENVRDSLRIYSYPNLASQFQWSAHFKGGFWTKGYLCVSCLPSPYFCKEGRSDESSCSSCDSNVCLNSLSTLGELLCALNLLIWEAFREGEKEKYRFELIVSQIPDLQEDCKNQSENFLKGFKEPRLLTKVGKEFKIQGAIIKSSRYLVSPQCSPPYAEEALDLPLLSCLEELMPFIYVGKIKPVFFEDRFTLIELLEK